MAIHLEANTFFTADLHFNHKNILKHSNRDFASIEAMNDALLCNINYCVGRKDNLVILGDFMWFYDKKAYESFQKLQNRILCKNVYYVFGNHDKDLRKFAKQDKLEWVKSGDILEFVIEDIPVVCCHYAMRVWNKIHHGAIQLYGHSHGSLVEDLSLRSMDVGIDSAKVLLGDYAPFPWSYIKDRLLPRNYTPVDHHGKPKN